MASHSAPVQLVHIGRQAVYDRDGQVVAYELLFQGGPDGEASAARRSLYATSQLIVNAFTEFGLEQLVGARTCFLNVTRDFLTGELPVPFGPGQAVLEILGSLQIDDAVLDGVQHLVDQGYAIAVDDDSAVDLQSRLWSLASYVKIDVSGRVAGELDAAVAPFRRRGGLQLVAERVDTDEHRMMAERLGFDLLQGRALGRPQVLTVSSLSPSRLRRLELLAALNAEHVDIPDVVSIVTGDPGLSYRVLQATNSASTGLKRKISSVHEAVVILGLDRIRQWVALMLVSDVADAATDDQLATTMARARLCQAIAKRLELDSDAAFTVGLLAGIADLLAEPVEGMVERLRLADAVAEALVHGTNRLGQVLSMVRSYEAADTDALRDAPVSPAEMVRAYLAAVGWSVTTVDKVLDSSRRHARRRLPPGYVRSH